MATGIEDLTARAKQLIAERSYQDAVRTCRRILLSRPDETPVRRLLGQALIAVRRYDEARVEMMAVLRADPSDSVAHRLLGEAHLRGGDPVRAGESLRRALQLDAGDEEARELLGEVAEETAPTSSTIDRWFDPEAVATLQTDAPPFQEDQTGPVPDISQIDPPSVQIDPSLTEEAEARAAAEPRTAEVNPPAPRRRSSFPAPPASSPPRAGPPKKSTLRQPSAPPSSMPPPPSEAFESLTAAHRPAAKRNGDLRLPPPPREMTDELSLQDVDEIESLQGGGHALDADSYEELEGEPTRARSSYDPLADPDDEIEGEATLVRTSDDPEYDAFYQALEEGPTIARDPSSRPPPPGPGYPPAPQWEQGPPSPGWDQPQWDQGHAAGWQQPPASAPWPPEPALGPTGFPEDPVLPPGSQGFQAPPSPAVGMPAQPSPSPGAARDRTPTPTPLTGPGVDPNQPPAVAQRDRSTDRPRRAGPPRALLLGLLVLVPLGLGLAAFFGFSAWRESTAEEEIQAAVHEATDDGLRTSLDEAIELAAAHDDDDAEHVALRARLLATAALEHGEEVADEAQALLNQLGSEETALPDARIATAYLALVRGNVQAAQQAVSDVAEDSAELWRARALVAAAAKDVPRAVPAARAAVTERPTSPRHVALLAMLMALNRDTAAALEALDGVPGGESSPAVRLTRARILLESGSDPRRAAAEATAVIEELGETASPKQKAWAHLVRARQAAFFSGDEATALEQARAAAGLRPSHDESFALSLAETFLRVAAPEEAQQVIAELPEQSQEPQRRAKLVAEVALANDDLEAAEAALEAADDDARTAFLRGRIREERGQLGEARALYERAMQDPRESVRARARLGAIELEQGHADRAVELLDPAREREPSNLDVIPVLVRALLETDRADRAEEVVRVALSLREGSVELLEAKARVALAQGALEEALESLRQVAERREHDPEVHTTLGDAARRAGKTDEARAAYEKALELDEEQVSALLGLAQLAVEEGNVERADELLERAREAGASGEGLDRARAQILVLQGAGMEAIETLEELAEGSEDSRLWVALGRAQLQAEQDRAAMRTFQRALDLNDDEPEAHLGLAHLQTRAGQLSRVARSIGEAERAARRRGLGSEFDARILAARGRLRFELGDFDDATAKAEAAIEKDPRASEAHLLLANIAIEEGDDPIPHLRAAVEGRAPLPEALGRLASRLRGEEACELARRYMRAAPRGYDAPDVQDVLDRCR